jgi:hypothetical protein
LAKAASLLIRSWLSPIADSSVAAVFGADTVDGAQLGCGGGGDRVDVPFQLGGFGVEVKAARGQ